MRQLIMIEMYIDKAFKTLVCFLDTANY